MDNKNIIQFPNPKEEKALDICKWGWEEFRDVFNVLAPSLGEDVAWQTIYEIWQIRAGEKNS